MKGFPSLRKALVALALLTTLATCGDPAREGAPAHPNLLFIVVDTLRTDRVGAYGHTRDTTPAIDALAAQAIRFEHAYASAPWTKPSVASMLTGLHASAHSVVRAASNLPGSALTLAEHLQGAGFATSAVVSHELIGRRYAYDQGFEHFDQDQAAGHLSVSTPAVTDLAIEQLASLSEGGRPFFLFVHYFDPHYVYLRHPEYGFAGERPERIRWNKGVAGLRRLDPPPSEEEIAYLLDAYDEEVRFTDAGIGRLLEALRERGLADDTWIVFTADHGEEFFERGWLGHSTTLFDELVRVPLIIRPPGEAGRPGVVEAPVSLVSLTPTLLEVLGVDPGAAPFQEPSLSAWLADPDHAASKPVYVELDYRRDARTDDARDASSLRMAALVDGNLKLIYDERGETLRLYDLRADPLERRDIGAERPQDVARLRAALLARMQAVRENRLAPDAQTLTPDDKQRLEALGYLEDE